MAKKRPSEVNILGTTYKVEYSDIVTDDKDTEQVYGLTHIYDNVIKISTGKNKTEESLESTLLHETIHAALGVSGVSQILDENVEEAVVVCLENALRSLYKRDYV